MGIMAYGGGVCLTGCFQRVINWRGCRFESNPLRKVLCNLAAVWSAEAVLYSIQQMRLLYETPSIAWSTTRDLK
jgi:hypothetical protein